VKFGPLPLAESEGVFLAQAVRRSGLYLHKGEWIGAQEIAALKAVQIEEIVAARLEEGDVDENTAALRLAMSVSGNNVNVVKTPTGRCNLVADCAGVLLVDGQTVDHVNMQDEAITLATHRPFQRVAKGEMVATVKIIPFAVETIALERACAVAAEHPLRVAAFHPLQVGVVSTVLPETKPSIIGKALRTLEERLEPSESRIVRDDCTPHRMQPLATALRRMVGACDLIVIFGASAITDRRDVVPSAIEEASGLILHFGMPVEPGNLLLLGTLPAGEWMIPVIGAPGCARSPKKNGFDFVLDRILAGLPIGSEEIRKMGVGGLLIETAAQEENPLESNTRSR